VDLTSGIGSDLIGIAAFNPATGYELDPVRAEYARHNLVAYGRNAEVIAGDGLAADWDAEYAFCDPSRRLEGRRTLKLSEFAPDPRLVAERFRELKLGGIKLSPMLPDQELESFGGSLEFISYGGECREALVWLGRSAPDVPRFATHIESGETLAAGGDPVVESSPGSYVYAADPAAIRAHCLGTLCSEFGLFGLARSNGYLTGEQPISTVWLKAYEVLAWHSADLKRTASELKRLGGGTPVIKSRGAKVDVEKLRHQLRGPGEELVLMIYPEGQSLKHAICRAV
jgi:hypothetical protein